METSLVKSPRHGLILAGLLLVTFLAFGPGLANGFINMDDPGYVTQNEFVRSGLTQRNILWALQTLHLGFWQPLTWLSLQLDASLFGTDTAWGFHLTNNLLHAACVGLLYWWLVRATRQPGRSAMVALLFGLHPLHVESVAWVTERKDVLSTFFLLLTLLAYLRYAEAPGWARYGLVVICFFLGLASKPMLVTLPVVLLVLDWWPLKRMPRSDGKPWPSLAALPRLLLEKSPLLVLAFLFTALTLYGHGRGSVASLEQFGLERRLANAAYSWGWYLEKTWVPVGLMAFYPQEHFAFFSWPVLIRLAWLLGSFGVLVLLSGGSRACWVGWAWFAITLLPVGGLVQVGETARADRFVYVPHIGLFVAIVWTVADVWDRWRVPRGWQVLVGLAVGLGCGVLTWNQVRTWRDDFTLWSHALSIRPDHYWAHHEMGKVWHERYRTQGNRDNLERALWHLEKERDLTGGNTRVFSSLAVIHFEKNELDKAQQNLDKSLEIFPNDAPSLLLYGTILSQQKKMEAALAYFRQANQLEKNNPRIARDLTLALVQLAEKHQGEGDLDQSQALREEARQVLHHILGQLENHPEQRTPLEAILRDIEAGVTKK
jgi:hypothetical protein